MFSAPPDKLAATQNSLWQKIKAGDAEGKKRLLQGVARSHLGGVNRI